MRMATLHTWRDGVSAVCNMPVRDAIRQARAHVARNLGTQVIRRWKRPNGEPNCRGWTVHPYGADNGAGARVTLL